jgi:hypothetical protein
LATYHLRLKDNEHQQRAPVTGAVFEFRKGYAYYLDEDLQMALLAQGARVEFTADAGI